MRCLPTSSRQKTPVCSSLGMENRLPDSFRSLFREMGAAARFIWEVRDPHQPRPLCSKRSSDIDLRPYGYKRARPSHNFTARVFKQTSKDESCTPSLGHLHHGAFVVRHYGAWTREKEHCRMGSPSQVLGLEVTPRLSSFCGNVPPLLTRSSLEDRGRVSFFLRPPRQTSADFFVRCVGMAS